MSLVHLPGAIMNCLVLGGAGFIGRHLCKTLEAEGHQVLAFDLPPEDPKRNWPPIKNIHWIAGDFTRADSVKGLLDGVQVVYHLIGTTLPASSNQNMLYDLESNVAATLRLLDAIVARPKPPRLIFISSGGTVYGIPKEIPIREDHPTDPICAYGVGKLAIEKYLLVYNKLYSLDYCILRLSNVYGPNQPLNREQGVIPIFLHRAFHNLPLEIWGDGSVVRDYLYVEDLCEALISVKEYSGEERIFNIGSGQGYSLNDLIEIIGRILGYHVKCNYFPGRPYDVPQNVLNPARASRELNWGPKIRIDEGIERLLPWIRKL